MIDLTHSISYENNEAVLIFSIDCVQADSTVNFEEFSKKYNINELVQDYFSKHNVAYSGDHLEILYQNKLVKSIPFAEINFNHTFSGSAHLVVVHTIDTSDTLESIALMYNTTRQSLLTLNQKTEHQLLRMQEIKVVPNASKMMIHVCKWGDHLHHIALTYNADIELIEQINNVKTVHPDQPIIVPLFDFTETNTTNSDRQYKNRLVTIFESSYKELMKHGHANQLYSHRKNKVNTEHTHKEIITSKVDIHKKYGVKDNSDLVANYSSGTPNKHSIYKVNKTVEEPKRDPYIPDYVTVRHAKSNKIYFYSLEDYLISSIASQVNINSSEEYIKAIAVICRTYIVEKYYRNNKYIASTSDYEQQLLDIDSIKEKWKQQTESQINRIVKAIEDTHHKIITHQGIPITPVTFTSSNGHTLNSENSILGTYYPYLRCVDSSFDIEAPSYMQKKNIPISYLNSLLSSTISKKDDIEVIAYTEGDYVKTVKICNQTYSGIYIYKKLKLSSPCFDFRYNRKQLEITCYGNGECVGLSKYGAEQLATQGKSYIEIIQHYYKHTKVRSIK